MAHYSYPEYPGRSAPPFLYTTPKGTDGEAFHPPLQKHARSLLPIRLVPIVTPIVIGYRVYTGSPARDGILRVLRLPPAEEVETLPFVCTRQIHRVSHRSSSLTCPETQLRLGATALQRDRSPFQRCCKAADAKVLSELWLVEVAGFSGTTQSAISSIRGSELRLGREI